MSRSSRWLQLTLGGAIVGTWLLLPVSPALFSLPAVEPELVAAEALVDRAQEAYSDLRVDEAAELFEEAGRRALGLDPALAALAFNNACNTRNEIGDFEKALADCDEALRLRAPDNILGIARSRNNRGLSLLELGRLREAEEDFEDALRNNNDIADTEGMVINRTNLALVEDARGRYQESLRYLDLAEASLREAPPAEWVLARRVGLGVNRAVLLTRLGRFDEALSVNRDLLDLGLGERERAFVLSNLALSVHLQGDSLRAAELLNEAEALYSTIGDEVGIASVRLSRGTVRSEGQADQAGALEEFEAALKNSRAAGALNLGIEAAYQVARAALQGGDLARAAVAIADCKNWSQMTESRSGLASAEFAEALLFRARGDLVAAASLLESSLSRVERTTSSLRSSLDRGSYLAATREISEAAVAVQLELGDPTAALHLARSAKERVLVEATGEAATVLKTSESIDVGGQDHAAHATASDPQPGGAQPRHAPPTPENVRHLEYFYAEGRLLRWHLDRGSIDFSVRGSTDDLDSDLIALHRQLARRSLDEPIDQALVLRLSEQLLGNLGGLGDSPGELIIAADRRLRYLPFEMLPLPNATELANEPLADGAARRAPLLTERLSTRYALGGATNESTISATNSSPRIPGRLVLVAAENSPPARLPGGLRLRPLREAQQELAAIAIHLRRDAASVLTLSNAAASKKNLIATLNAPGAPPVDLLHIAAHAVLDESSEVGSALLLTATAEEDGAWRPREIAQLRLSIRLVVLSACSTALGFERDGRAVDSLVGALLASGAEGVVASLWDVGDHNARVFMDQFYYQLGRGLPAAQALRNTRQRLLADPAWNDPRLWAGFVLIGDSPRLTEPPTSRFQGSWSVALGLLAATGAFLFVAYFFWSYSQRRRLTE